MRIIFSTTTRCSQQTINGRGFTATRRIGYILKRVVENNYGIIGSCLQRAV